MITRMKTTMLAVWPKTAVMIVAAALMAVVSLQTTSAQATDPCTTDNVSAEGKKLFCAGGTPDINGLINSVINWVMGIVGAVVVLVVIIAAVQLASSAGNPEAIKSAKSRLTNAIIGLVLLISLYAIFRLIGIAK